MKKYFILCNLLFWSLTSFAQGQYTSLDWDALPRQWIISPEEYQAENRDEYLDFQFLSLTITDDETFQARLTPLSFSEGTYQISESERTILFKPVGGGALVLYSVARADENELILELKSASQGWPWLMALRPALLIADQSKINVKNLYTNKLHGYSFTVPKGWQGQAVKYFQETDALWFSTKSNITLWIDFSPLGYGLKSQELTNKFLAAEKGNYRTQGLVAGTKNIKWFDLYYEHNRRQTRRLVYLLTNKGQHVLVNVQMPDADWAVQKKQFDALIKTFKWQ